MPRVDLHQLLYGSDRPIVEPAHNRRDALLKAQAGALLVGREVAAA